MINEGGLKISLINATIFFALIFKQDLYRPINYWSYCVDYYLTPLFFVEHVGRYYKLEITLSRFLSKRALGTIV